MPSIIFQIAVAVLIGMILLLRNFNLKTFYILTIITVFPDIDSFFSVWIPDYHRTYIHNIFIPIIFAISFYYDTNFANR